MGGDAAQKASQNCTTPLRVFLAPSLIKGFCVLLASAVVLDLPRIEAFSSKVNHVFLVQIPSPLNCKAFDDLYFQTPLPMHSYVRGVSTYQDVCESV